MAATGSPSGVLSNELLAQGGTTHDVGEHVEVGGWRVNLETQGPSDFYFQDLRLGPGGRSGWHTHPGLLMITVKEGNVDWYDQRCAKSSFAAGQSFTESSEAHEVVNPGPGITRLVIGYITKHGDPRRKDSEPPACAEAQGIP